MSSEYNELIINSSLFENVARDTILSAIVPGGHIVNLSRGSSLFLPRDSVNCIYILLSGKIKLVFYMENGEQDIRNIVLPPRLIGVDLVCTRTRISPYQACALEKSAVFAVPADIILSPGVFPEKERLICVSNLLRIISNINMQNEYRLAILTRNSLRDRVMVYLTMQANKAGSESFTIPFSRDEMASFLRVNRSALSHELGLLKKEGIIDFYKNRFTLLSRQDYDMAIYGFSFKKQ